MIIVPPSPTDVSVNLKYNATSQLQVVSVQWKEVVSFNS